MSTNRLEINTKIQILRPAEEVFESIVDPARMSNYFISRSTGRLEEGKEVFWRFPEFDMEFPVRGKKMVKNQYISFAWDVDGNELLVEMELEPVNEDSTVVSISEKSMENNEAGLKWLAGNTAGWANFLACLKAYAEYGINLRKGAFDFMKQAGS